MTPDATKQKPSMKNRGRFIWRPEDVVIVRQPEPPAAPQPPPSALPDVGGLHNEHTKD